jgi:hypothetical protein
MCWCAVYEFNTVPFGLDGVPKFQRMMAKMLRLFANGELITYMDDILLPSYTVETGLLKLRKVLDVVRKAGLTLKLMHNMVKRSLLGKIIELCVVCFW